MNSFAKAARLGLTSAGLLLALLALASTQPAQADEAVGTLTIHVENVRAGGLVRLGDHSHRRSLRAAAFFQWATYATTLR